MRREQGGEDQHAAAGKERVADLEGRVLRRGSEQGDGPFLDGVGQGASSAYTEDRYLKVSAGKHVLELRLAGYETYSREIYVANSLLWIEAGLIRK